MQRHMYIRAIVCIKILTLYTNAPVLTHNTVHENYCAAQCLGCIRLGITVTLLLFFKKTCSPGNRLGRSRAIAGNRYKVFFSMYNKNRAISASFARPTHGLQIRAA